MNASSGFPSLWRRPRRAAVALRGTWLALWLGLASLPVMGAAEAPWFTRSLVGLEVGPTGAEFAGGKHAPGYASNFNGKEIGRSSVRANAEYLVLWVRDGEFTFHESKRLPRPPGQGDRDVLREAAEEGRRLNLPIRQRRLAPGARWSARSTATCSSLAAIRSSATTRWAGCCARSTWTSCW